MYNEAASELRTIPSSILEDCLRIPHSKDFLIGDSLDPAKESNPIGLTFTALEVVSELIACLVASLACNF